MTKKNKYKFLNSKLTSAISISLVLFLLGCILIVGCVSRELTGSLLENVTLTIYLDNKANQTDIEELTYYLSNQKYAKKRQYISKEQAIQDLCAEIGEDPEEFKNDNPLPNTFVINMEAVYANNDSLTMIVKDLEKFDFIKRTEYPKTMVHTIVRNINRFALMLSAAMIVMLIISYGLIHNTIQLLVRADRFIIHTMKLVGATGGFIQKPYLLQGLLIAIIAFIFATLYFIIIGYFFKDDRLFQVLGLDNLGNYVMLLGSLLICSILITTTASFFAVNKYLRQDSNELYYI